MGIEEYNIENRKKELKIFVYPTLRAADFQILFSAMKAFHDAYMSSQTDGCKKKAIEFLIENKYIKDETYVKVQHTITVDEAKKLLNAFKRAYVNAISINTREYDEIKSKGVWVKTISPNATKPRVKEKEDNDSRVDPKYPENLYEAWEDNPKKFPAAVVTDENETKKRSECVNGLRKKKIPFSKFNSIFNATIQGRPPKEKNTNAPLQQLLP